MRGSRQWHGYAILSQPLTVLGVERRFFLLAATLGAAIWNAVNSLSAGGLVFGVLYAAGWPGGRAGPEPGRGGRGGRHDQNRVGVVRAAVRSRSRYDAGLLEDRSPYVVIERSEG